MNNITLAIGFGLVTASILALSAVGFTLQFGVTNILNLSYGQVMTIAMFVAYLVNVTAGASIWFGLAAGAAAGAILTGLLNLTVFAPFLRRGASPGTVIIVSLALGIVLENALLAVVGPQFRSYNQPVSPQSLHFLGMILTTQQVAIIVIAVAVMLALHGLLRFTRLGKAMRATAVNLVLARNCGISTGRVTMIAWILSGALCGAGGVTLAINLATFQQTTGSDFILVVIAAAVFGGIGQPYGAMLGALVIGLATELAALISPNLKQVIAFAVLALMLLVRPNGLIAAPETQSEILTE
jgi:branched-chain amino acid transport system permease protein/neutral amino acid transport system permease protein